MLRTFKISSFATICIASPALAQDEQDIIGPGHDAVQAAPVQSGIGLNELPILEFTATQDKQIVSLEWSLISSRGHKLPGSGVINSSFDQLTMKVSATLKDGQDDRTLLTLDGFNTGTSIKLIWTHFIKQTRANPDVNSMLDSATEIAVQRCREHADNRYLSPAEQSRNCDMNNPGNGGASYMLSRYNPNGFRTARRAIYRSSLVPFFGAAFEGNQEKFKYIDRSNFSSKKSDRRGYQATAFLGAFFRDSPTIARASVSLAKKFSASDPFSLCRPANIPLQTECLEGADGPPSRAIQRTVGLQLIHAFANDDAQIPKFAIAPQVSWDFKNDAYEASLPVYLARNSDRKPSGGVRLNYIDAKQKDGSRKHDFSFGLFVGVPLDFGL